VVHFFDPTKKGFITSGDIKTADSLRSLDHLTDDDLHHFFGGGGSYSASQMNADPSERIEY